MITLNHPLTIGEDPSPELKARLERTLRRHGYEARLLESLLRDGHVVASELADRLIASEPSTDYDLLHEAMINVWADVEKAQHYLPRVERTKARHRIEA